MGFNQLEVTLDLTLLPSTVGVYQAITLPRRSRKGVGRVSSI